MPAAIASPALPKGARRRRGGSCPAVGRVDAEQRARDLGAAAADQAAEPEDLAAAHAEADVARTRPRRVRPLDLEQHLARHRLAVRVECRELAADHQADRPVARAARRPARRRPAGRRAAPRCGRRRGRSRPCGGRRTSSRRPAGAASSTTSNSRSTSRCDSAAVGSSMISTRAFSVSARAISTSCCSEVRRPPSFALDVDRQADRGEHRLGLPRHRGAIEPPQAPRGMCPMKTFSATLRSGKSPGCWCMTATPAALRVERRGEGHRRARRARRCRATGG